MKKFVIASALLGLLSFAGPAMAWDYDECVEVNFDHPDCEQFKPPVETPPVETPPPVVAPPEVTPPAPPVETPPLADTTSTPPAQMTEELKEPPSEKEITFEKKETSKPNYRPGTPAVPKTQTVSVSDTSTLPYTGLPAGLLALAGLALALGGFAVRRVAT